MSKQPDLKALALRGGEQAMVPKYGNPESLARLYGSGGAAHSEAHQHVVYTREHQGLFGTWTKETLSFELREQHWLDRHENTNDSRHGDEVAQWLR